MWVKIDSDYICLNATRSIASELTTWCLSYEFLLLRVALAKLIYETLFRAWRCELDTVEAQLQGLDSASIAAINVDLHRVQRDLTVRGRLRHPGVQLQSAINHGS